MPLPGWAVPEMMLEEVRVLSAQGEEDHGARVREDRLLGLLVELVEALVGEGETQAELPRLGEDPVEGQPREVLKLVYVKVERDAALRREAGPPERRDLELRDED